MAGYARSNRMDESRPSSARRGASIPNGHLIFKSGFWLGTAEDLFERPDRQIGSTIEGMIEAASRAGFVTRTELNAGTRAVAMDGSLLRAVGECVGSLIVRSPLRTKSDKDFSWGVGAL